MKHFAIQVLNFRVCQKFDPKFVHCNLKVTSSLDCIYNTPVLIFFFTQYLTYSEFVISFLLSNGAVINSRFTPGAVSVEGNSADCR